MLKRVYNKYGWILVVILLLLWICLTPSHFQKGGVDPEFYLIISLFIVCISILITLLFNNFTVFEKIVIAISFSFISLFLTTMVIVPTIVDYFYGDKTWFLWETKYRLFINTIYYGLNAILVTLLTTIYFMLRRKMRRKQKLTGSFG